jgi:hypothetical protein
METQNCVPFVRDVINIESVAMDAQQCVLCTAALHIGLPISRNTLRCSCIVSDIFVRFQPNMQFLDGFFFLKATSIKFHDNPSNITHADTHATDTRTDRHGTNMNLSLFTRKRLKNVKNYVGTEITRQKLKSDTSKYKSR